MEIAKEIGMQIEHFQREYKGKLQNELFFSDQRGWLEIPKTLLVSALH